jgi:ATP-dependent RNA helicase DOB1
MGDLIVVPCSLDAIDGLSSIRVFVPKEVKSRESRTQLLKVLSEVDARFPTGIPLLDPIKDMAIKDESFKKLVQV